MSESTYLRPIRDAAKATAAQIHHSQPDEVELYAALIDFAGAILDAVRAEAAEQQVRARMKLLGQRIDAVSEQYGI